VDGALSGSAGARQDRSAGQDAPPIGTPQRRTRPNRSERSRVLRTQCRPNALSSFPRTRAVRWVRRGRGGMQNCGRSALETLRIVLDCRRRQRHHRPALLPLQPKVRRLLGNPFPRRLITHFYVAHPPGTGGSRIGPFFVTPRSCRRCLASCGGTYASFVAPIRNRSMPCAALRPSAMAQTTSDWPRRMSPAANTPGTLDI